MFLMVRWNLAPRIIIPRDIRYELLNFIKVRFEVEKSGFWVNYQERKKDRLIQKI